MAKKQEPAKPLFPLKHEFAASLDAFCHEAGMLRDAVRQMLQMPGVMTNDALRGILQERLDAFDKARFGNVDR